MYKTVEDQQKTMPKNNLCLNQESMASHNFVVKKRKSGNLCKDQHQNEELSLAPETSIIPMKS